MGQKTNPNILRLGQTKEWKSKYIEKKSNELFGYAFNYLEIQKFISKFFEKNGLIVNDCKISQSENFLHIFVSYFTLPKAKQLINTASSKQKIKIAFKKRKSHKFLKKKASLRKNILNYSLYNQKYFSEKIYENLKSNGSVNQIKNHYFINTKFRRLNGIDYYKKYKNINLYKNITHVKTHLFLQKIFESVYLFLKKKTAIRLSLKQLNSDNAVIKTFSKKKKNLISRNLLKLRKFQKNDFFKAGVTLLYSCIINHKSSELLAKYVAFYLKLFKRHNFFLNFLKNTLKIFLNKNFSKIKRIKISVKGRFNGAPRAKTKTLSIGVPPSLTLNSDINYSESTSFTPNGTFGIKVWAHS
jgi:ribosomal protein S3